MKGNKNTFWFVQVFVTSCSIARTSVFELDGTASCGYFSVVGAGRTGRELWSFSKKIIHTYPV